MMAWSAKLLALVSRHVYSGVKRKLSTCRSAAVKGALRAGTCMKLGKDQLLDETLSPFFFPGSASSRPRPHLSSTVVEISHR
jgi:hypothetical protein